MILVSRKMSIKTLDTNSSGKRMRWVWYERGYDVWYELFCLEFLESSEIALKHPSCALHTEVHINRVHNAVRRSDEGGKGKSNLQYVHGWLNLWSDWKVQEVKSERRVCKSVYSFPVNNKFIIPIQISAESALTFKFYPSTHIPFDFNNTYQDCFSSLLEAWSWQHEDQIIRLLTLLLLFLILPASISSEITSRDKVILCDP